MDKEIICEFIKKLQTSDEKFSAVPFWFLNDELSEEKLRKDIKDFKEKGLDIIIPHPRIGIPETIKYLSEEFFYYIGVILDQAEKSGLKVILYDEGMYPSGSAGGIICKNNNALKSKGLFLVKRPKIREERIFRTNKGYLVYKETQGRIRGIHFGEDDGEPNQPYSADILNPEAVSEFIRLTHEEYYKRFKRYFGNVLLGFFTDEPNQMGRGIFEAYPWYKELKGDLIKNGGELEKLSALFEGKENLTVKIYRKLLSDRISTVYLGKIKSWCEAHNVMLFGHPAHSDDVSELYSFSIPGQDLIARFVSPETGDTEGFNSVLGKVPADVAELRGIKRNMCEALGVCGKEDDPWHLPPGDIKWYLDYLAVRGVNMFVLHAFYYSLRGKRKEERPPDIGYNNVWWQDYSYFSEYIKRISFIMSDIRSLSDVAIEVSNQNVPYKEVKELYKNQIQFTYLPEFEKDKNHEFRYKYSENDPINVSKLKKERKVFFESFQPDVRIKHFVKGGFECCFVVNAGEKNINDNLIFNSQKNILVFDLWNNEYRSCKCAETNKGKVLSVKLPPRKSLLFVLHNDEISDLSDCEENFFSPNFEFVSEEENCKTYRAEMFLPQKDINATVKLKAEETVEWFVNGKKIYCSFWNEHICRLGKFLEKGKNEILIKVYGSTANIYGKKRYPFGLL